MQSDTQTRTLVLGIGNLLMGDEGVGVHVLRHLEAHHPLPGVDYLDGGTGGFHLLGCLQAYPRVVIVDATVDGSTPGTVSVLEPEYSSDYPTTLTAHDIGLKDLIDAMYLVAPRPRIALVAVSIGGLGEMSLELSGAVGAAVVPAAEAVLRYLERGSS